MTPPSQVTGKEDARNPARRQGSLSSWGRLAVLVACSTVGAWGCSGKGDEAKSDDSAAQKVHGLTAKQSAEVLARVGDVEITAGELAARLAEQSPYVRARYENPEHRREFLENMVRFELLAQEAKKRGLYDLPEVEQAKKQAMIEELLRQEVGDSLDLGSITDEEVRAYYEKHRDEFNQPEQVRASQIVFQNRAKAETTLVELSQINDDGELFRHYVAEHSTDGATKERHGDLGFFSRPGIDRGSEVPPTIAEAVFAIEELGAIHPEVVEHGGAFHILKLTARREALHRSLDEARRAVQHRIWRQKRKAATDQLLERLRKEAQIKKDGSALEEIQVDLPGAAPHESTNP